MRCEGTSPIGPASSSPKPGHGYKFPCFPSHLTVYIQPLKMELTQGSETSANYNLTPRKYPKEYVQYSNHGESLKSRKRALSLHLYVRCLSCLIMPSVSHQREITSNEEGQMMFLGDDMLQSVLYRVSLSFRLCCSELFVQLQ